jgi:hypothetical protein
VKDYARGSVKLKSEVIRGRTIEFYVDTGGQFHAIVRTAGGPVNVKKDTFEECREAVQRTLRRALAKIAIDATLLSHADDEEQEFACERIVLTGLHTRDRVILYRDGAGKAQRLDQWQAENKPRGRVLRRLTDDEEGSLLTAQRAMVVAVEAYAMLVAGFRIDGREMLEAAIAKAEQAPDVG